jgi:hypothetical protein
MRTIVSLLLLIGILTVPDVQGKKPKTPKDWTGHKISEVIEKFGPQPLSMMTGRKRSMHGSSAARVLTLAMAT